jgi:hypothetical protein
MGLDKKKTPARSQAGVVKLFGLCQGLSPPSDNNPDNAKAN